LGPFEYKLSGDTRVIRTDIEILGARNHKIKCSHFEPDECERRMDEMPCVIYCHGNSSCRLEALELIPLLIKSNITLFCFDFPACGMSEGDYISLGWYEKDEIHIIIDYLR